VSGADDMRADAHLAGQTLAEPIRAGDRRALARALTLVENDLPAGRRLLEALGASPPTPGARAHRIGLTGPPGAGKSTLVSALTAAWREAGRRVGILAVDPSSPFTGGALLGDRIRMLSHSGDEGVFIRSLASRGAWGGLAAAVYDAADLIEAAGFDPVLLETVGVGQGEVEVCRAADTTVVVLAPGSGDVVQGMKAGLLEIADILVVNQADREGAEALVHALESAFALRDQRAPPILRTVATEGRGVPALRAELDARLQSDAGILSARRRERARARLRAAVDRARSQAFWAGREALLETLAEAVAAGNTTAAGALRTLLGQDGGGESHERT
jgi:LAO/AO transport system kinase